MKIVVISDTHLRHEQLVIPDADYLIHAGDFSIFGNFEDVTNFSRWINALPHRFKLLLPGNHDRFCEGNMSLCKELFAPTLFEDSGLVKLGELWILCYSWTPSPNHNSKWKFHPPYGERTMFEKFWECAPPVDILVTHGPPLGILDHVDRTYPGEDPHVGEFYMREYVQKHKPKIHIFGHIHESYGTTSNGDTRFYNASICDIKYNPINPITIIETDDFF